MNSYHSNAAQQQANAPASMAAASCAPLLDALNDRLGGLHKVVNELHEFADRVVGIRDDGGKVSVPAGVPNGLIEQVADSAYNLECRLRGLCERLSRI